MTAILTTILLLVLGGLIAGGAIQDIKGLWQRNKRR